MGPRQTLRGRAFTVDLLADGTGIVRRNRDNAPLASISSLTAARVRDTVETVVDLVAEAAAAKPAPWTEQDQCNNKS